MRRGEKTQLAFEAAVEGSRLTSLAKEWIAISEGLMERKEEERGQRAQEERLNSRKPGRHAKLAPQPAEGEQGCLGGI